MELRLCLVPSKILGEEKKVIWKFIFQSLENMKSVRKKNTKSKIVIFFLLFSLKINEESKRENYFP